MFCFLQPLGIQHRKLQDDEEHHTGTALEYSPLIRTNEPENAALIIQGISSTQHISIISSAAIRLQFIAKICFNL